ncbi:MAG: NAD(P)-dependent glycerol-3-phosphate dehydrogenase [Burkholderiales bacterium]|nr:NAD(P)-dependent glycerol-3-phosphate dehydrogenase [Burkholderiales bacterium]
MKASDFSIVVLGAGAWGTAFAIHLARDEQNRRVVLWARDQEQAKAIRETRINARYLPENWLPDSITITASLEEALTGVSLIIAAPPVAALPELMGHCQLILATENTVPFFWLSKGFLFDKQQIMLPHQLLSKRWSAPVGLISGPSFAQEVAAGLPTALVVAATAFSCAEQVAADVRCATLRVYPNDDIIGVETGGAVKNVLAIAAGICDGLSLGHNARATLMTRGLAEMARLTEALGGKVTTLMGLAGLGDLILTCTGDLSRNRRVGMLLAEGMNLDDILTRLGHVAEGVAAARAITILAERFAIELPVSAAVADILEQKITPREAVERLLNRAPVAE